MNFLTTGIDFWGQKTYPKTPIVTFIGDKKNFLKFSHFPTLKKGVTLSAQVKF